MFELSVALKYLIPKRKQLSVSLISLMSIGVISLVVWLLLLFLSVTEGIERGWLEKLTALNAPIRITPTHDYYRSYYYQIDSISGRSQYTSKSIFEKTHAALSDPYDPDCDEQIPSHWMTADRYPDGTLKDPVKKAQEILRQQHLVFQDYEVSGALLRLHLLRPQSQLISNRTDPTQNALTQVSYVASFSEQNPHIRSLIRHPTAQDLNNLLYLGNLRALPLASLLDAMQIKQLKTSLRSWRVPGHLLPEKRSLYAKPLFYRGELSHFILTKAPGSAPLLRRGDALFFDQQSHPLSTPLFSEEELYFTPFSLDYGEAEELSAVRIGVEGSLQGVALRGEIHWEGLEIAEATLNSLDALAPANSAGIYLAKGFQESGVKIGDRGYLSYSAPTASGVQEQRLPVHVTGFYDPGIMAVGNKCILAPAAVVHTIGAANGSFHLDPTESNGIHVWCANIDDAGATKKALEEAFTQAGIDRYWKISSFREYDFARDLLQQFQSDKYLFTLVGIIILTVACCNIISLLVLLVNDKKREIGILQAMGASTRSIAAIFGLAGILMGVVSSLIGVGAALLTLHNIDLLVGFLSALQGHDAFNTAFYGSALPSTLSSSALLFIMVATPLLSLLAGLVPAIKACRLRPSLLLRSECS